MSTLKLLSGGRENGKPGSPPLKTVTPAYSRVLNRLGLFCGTAHNPFA